MEITKSDLWDLFVKQEGRCALSGVPIELLIRKRSTASLDRINSTGSYTLNNIQWVHKDVNRMKSNLPPERFLELCHQISRHHGGTSSGPMPDSPKPRHRKRPGKKTEAAPVQGEGLQEWPRGVLLTLPTGSEDAKDSTETLVDGIPKEEALFILAGPFRP